MPSGYGSDYEIFLQIHKQSLRFRTKTWINKKNLNLNYRSYLTLKFVVIYASISKLFPNVQRNKLNSVHTDYYKKIPPNSDQVVLIGFCATFHRLPFSSMKNKGKNKQTCKSKNWILAYFTLISFYTIYLNILLTNVRP